MRAEISMTHSDAGGLSTVMKFGGVGRAEEERLPALRAGLDGRGVERVGPAGRAEAPQVEQAGRGEQREQRRPDPRRVVGSSAPEESDARARHHRRCHGGAVDVGSPADVGGGHLELGRRDRRDVGQRRHELRVVGGGHRRSFGRARPGPAARRRGRGAGRPTRGRAGSGRASRRRSRRRARATSTQGCGVGRRSRAAGRASRRSARGRARTRASPCSWWRKRSAAPAHAEGEAAVGRGVADRGEQQRGDVRALRAHRPAQEQEEREVGQRRRDADRGEPHELRGEPARHVVAGVRRQLGRRGCARRPARGRAARCRGGRPSRSPRCRRGSRGRRPSRPAPRGCAGRARSASTSSSVSKNQPVSSTSGSSSRARSARIALNPHCASENRVASVVRSSRL